MVSGRLRDKKTRRPNTISAGYTYEAKGWTKALEGRRYGINALRGRATFALETTLVPCLPKVRECYKTKPRRRSGIRAA